LRDSANFAVTEFSEDEKANPPRSSLCERLQTFDGLLDPLWKEDRPTMDGRKGHPKMTAGGQIAESWGLSDELGLMRQIGAIPEPGREAGG
jgi:hypothetical protein